MTAGRGRAHGRRVVVGATVVRARRGRRSRRRPGRRCGGHRGCRRRRRGGGGSDSASGDDWAGSRAARTMMRCLAEYRGWHEVSVRIGVVARREHVVLRRRHDELVGDLVDEASAAGAGEDHLVPGRQLVDAEERRAVGGAVAGDADVAVLHRAGACPGSGPGPSSGRRRRRPTPRSSRGRWTAPPAGRRDRRGPAGPGRAVAAAASSVPPWSRCRARRVLGGAVVVVVAVVVVGGQRRRRTAARGGSGPGGSGCPCPTAGSRRRPAAGARSRRAPARPARPTSASRAGGGTAGR